MLRKISCALAAVCAVSLFGVRSADAQQWVPTAGTNNWGDTANWNPTTVPDAPGAAAVFDSTGNPDTAANIADVTGNFTVGSLLFDLTDSTGGTGNFDFRISGDSLTLDNGGGASITVQGTGPPNVDISADLVFSEDVNVNVNTEASQSSAGELVLTGDISGAGGLIKNGPGIVTISTTAKTYTGATVVNDGRYRVSVSGQPSVSSSFTVNSGGQIVFAGSANAFTLGAGSLNLNGTGSAAFPGAIRADGGARTISNPVDLQSDASINVPGAGNSLELLNVVSGPGRLELGTLPGNPGDLGQLILGAANTYSGGTLVTQGILVLSDASATLGSGDVFVDGLSLGPNSSVAAGFLQLDAGVLDAISDSALLTLTGDDGSDGAIAGKADLGLGIDEIVGSLVLGGVSQTMVGTYGSSASPADFQFDAFFLGEGVVRLVPEPASLVLLGLAAVGFVALRRTR